jgi:hypothetical protein
LVVAQTMAYHDLDGALVMFVMEFKRKPPDGGYRNLKPFAQHDANNRPCAGCPLGDENMYEAEAA